MKKYLNTQKWSVFIENGYYSTQIYKSLKKLKIAPDFLTRHLNDHFYSIKTYFVFFSFLLAGVSFSQSKKEQIEQLNYRVDSLNQVVSLKNKNISIQNTQIDSLNQIVINESKINSENTKRIAQLLDTIVLLKSKLTSLNLDLSNSNSQLQNIKTDNSEKEKQINSLKLSSQHKIDSLTNLSLNFQKENLFKIKEIDLLKVQIKAKADSLNKLQLEIEKNKLVKTVAPKTTINPVKQYTNYKSIKIGEQTWMQENLNESKFKNGEIIDQATTKEEWEKAGQDGKPAWCYYDNDAKNGVKYGKLYNWYAVNDPRGLAPEGWHIPTDNEWIDLKNFLGGVDASGVKLKSSSGWNGQGNGTNSSKFSGLPGGTRDAGNFMYLGEGAYFWSSTEAGKSYSYFRYLFYEINAMYGGMYVAKESGLSVRCIKD
jgi:uncharacterized protein (TIGR02145 family)